MTLIRDGNDITFRCDHKGCHETIETMTSDFNRAQDILHRHGWKHKSVGKGEWEHYCPEHQQGTLL